jgi:hypothetical protein
MCHVLVIFLAVRAVPVDPGPTVAGTWFINANGHQGELVLQVNGGQVTGTIYGVPIEGIYDPGTRRLFFKRMQSANNKRVVQEFSGSLTRVGGVDRPRFVLEGTFRSDVGMPWGAPGLNYVWYAQAVPKAAAP